MGVGKVAVEHKAEVDLDLDARLVRSRAAEHAERAVQAHELGK